MTDSHSTPAGFCWHCDQLLDAATEIGGEATPTPGAVSLCMYCGAVAVFDADLILRQPTKEFLDDLGDDRDFIRSYMQFTWARQYVMLRQSLMRRDRPD